MRRTRRSWVVAAPVVALMLAGCDTEPTGAPTETPTATTESPTSAGATTPPGAAVHVAACPPATLLPSGTDTCGQPIVAALFDRLTAMDPLSGEVAWGDDAPRALAEHVDSADAQHWRITLKPDRTFHDGDAVTADDVVRAWTDAVVRARQRRHGPLFDILAGFEEAVCANPPDCPTPARVRGVDAIDDLTLEVELAAPYREFPALLTHVAFAPIAPSFEEDPEAYAAAPVGTGPFRLRSGPQGTASPIDLEAVPEHPAAPMASEHVVFEPFESEEQSRRAFADGRVDVLAAVPPPEQAATVASRPGPTVSLLVMPSSHPWLSDPRVGEAFSLAIDRPAAVELLATAGAPATSLVPPTLPGAAPDVCGDACEHDPERAAELLAAAGGPPEEPLPLYGPADQRDALQIIEAQLERNLPGLQVRVVAESLSDFLARLERGDLDGPYRFGWSTLIPSLRSYLAPLHASGGGFNFDGYADPAVDEALEAADSAPTVEQARAGYRQAEQLVLEDWHHVPLWYHGSVVAHSATVDGVALDVFGNLVVEWVGPRDDAQPAAE